MYTNRYLPILLGPCKVNNWFLVPADTFWTSAVPVTIHMWKLAIVWFTMSASCKTVQVLHRVGVAGPSLPYYCLCETVHSYLIFVLSFFYCSIWWVQAYHPASLLEMCQNWMQAVRHQCLLFCHFQHCNALFRCAGKVQSNTNLTPVLNSVVCY